MNSFAYISSLNPHSLTTLDISGVFNVLIILRKFFAISIICVNILLYLEEDTFLRSKDVCPLSQHCTIVVELPLAGDLMLPVVSA